MDVVWPAPGTVLSLRYRLVTQLSSGGMSQVWRAEDDLLGRPVAIKLPTSSAEVVQQAFTEARTTARLSHPHIAAVHDYGETTRPDGSLAPFVVMELLDGPSLAARLADGPLPWPAAARIGAQVAEGLAAAHAKQVVHRDVKPGNVMLTPGGARILDFGISAVVGTPDDDDTGATFGTPAYVAPERLDGRPAEPATDVYGLGVVLFEMVTGDPPYPVDTWEELAEARRSGPRSLPPELPAEFRALVGRCLAEKPGARPTAAEVRDGLAALAAGFSGAAPSSAAGPSAAASSSGASSGGASSGGASSGGAGLSGAGPASSAGAPAAPGPRAYASGRAPAHTVALHPPARPKWPARAGLAAALTAAAAAVVVAISASTDSRQAAPPAPAPTTTTAEPTEPPEPPATPPATVAAPGDIGAAVGRVTSAVQAGQAAGRIRPDVALDLLNLLGQLDRAQPSEVTGRVEQLRQKVRTRAGEQGLTAEQADELQARLSELAGAAAPE